MGLKSVESKRRAANVPRVKGDKRRRSQEYWEQRLKRMHLGMEAGRRIGLDFIAYGHKVSDLDFDGNATYRPTAGERLEEYQEWPLTF